ncbi:MAG: DUF4956 domain-containing protein [Porcipelethomonas sp.]
MKKYLYSLFENTGSLTSGEIVLHIGAAVMLSIVIYLSYYFSHRGTVYSKKFNISLCVMTILTATVMTVIGNNIALSLGMVGALSIVRFRTALKDSRDTVYIFWTVIVGICCGVGDYFVAAIGSGAVFIVLLFFGTIKNDNRILLIVRGSRNAERDIQSAVFEYFRSRAMLRVNNSDRNSSELIFELPKREYCRCSECERSISEILYDIDDVEYVNVVSQSDEISG